MLGFLVLPPRWKREVFMFLCNYTFVIIEFRNENNLFLSALEILFYINVVIFSRLASFPFKDGRVWSLSVDIE